MTFSECARVLTGKDSLTKRDFLRVFGPASPSVQTSLLLEANGAAGSDNNWIREALYDLADALETRGLSPQLANFGINGLINEKWANESAAF